MAEQSIDFLNLNRKIIINPAVPLQILDIFCRNKMRVQATILGKVYSSSIEVLEIVPDALCDENDVNDNLIPRLKSLTLLTCHKLKITPELSKISNQSIPHCKSSESQSRIWPWTRTWLNYTLYTLTRRRDSSHKEFSDILSSYQSEHNSLPQPKISTFMHILTIPI